MSIFAAPSIEAAVGEVVFIKAEVMPEFVQEGVANVFPEELVIIFSDVPNVFEVKDDLLRDRRSVQLFRKVRSDKEPERVFLDAVGDQFV